MEDPPPQMPHQTPQPSRKGPKDDPAKEARLAAALRANLRRRKSAAGPPKA